MFQGFFKYITSAGRKRYWHGYGKLSNKKILKSVCLFDVYEGDKIEEDKKSYALSFTFQDDEKTLTDEEIDKVMSTIKGDFEKNLGAVLRS